MAVEILDNTNRPLVEDLRLHTTKARGKIANRRSEFLYLCF